MIKNDGAMQATNLFHYNKHIDTALHMHCARSHTPHEFKKFGYYVFILHVIVSLCVRECVRCTIEGKVDRRSIRRQPFSFSPTNRCITTKPNKFSILLISFKIYTPTTTTTKQRISIPKMYMKKEKKKTNKHSMMMTMNKKKTHIE